MTCVSGSAGHQGRRRDRQDLHPPRISGGSRLPIQLGLAPNARASVHGQFLPIGAGPRRAARPHAHPPSHPEGERARAPSLWRSPLEDPARPAGSSSGGRPLTLPRAREPHRQDRPSGGRLEGQNPWPGPPHPPLPAQLGLTGGLPRAEGRRAKSTRPFLASPGLSPRALSVHRQRGRRDPLAPIPSSPRSPGLLARPGHSRFLRPHRAPGDHRVAP